MELKVTLLFNIGVMLLGLWAIWRLLGYARAARFMGYRYEYFALRDRLGHLAANHIVDYDSPAYKALVRMLNTYIRNTEDIDLLAFVKGAIHAERAVASEHDELLEAARRNSELADILTDTSYLTIRVLHEGSLFLRLLLQFFRLGNQVRVTIHRTLGWLPIGQMFEVKEAQEERLATVKAFR